MEASRKSRLPWAPLAIAALVFGTPIAARAQIAVSVNDGHSVLIDGVVNNADGKDGMVVLDLSKTPPAKLAELNLPASVVGPPFSVAITTDERYAIVTASMKADPADRSKQVADNRVTLVELKPPSSLTGTLKGLVSRTPPPQPKILQTIEAGLVPAGVSVNRKGDLVLVANRGEGTLSVFALKNGKLENKGKVTIGNAASALGHVVITPDGKRALVTRDGDNLVSVLNIDGEKVEIAKRDIVAGIRPYGIAISNDGRFAIVANVGKASGDADTISLIDLTKEPYRVVDTLSVGQTPEGLQISPDGRHAAIVTHNGSSKPKASPFYNDSGRVVMVSISKDLKLARVSESKVGGWGRGAVFGRNGRTLLVQNMVEKNIMVFSHSGGKLTDTNQRITLDAGPAAIRIAEPAK